MRKFCYFRERIGWNSPYIAMIKKTKMKKYALTLAAFLVTSLSLLAIDASVSLATFNSPKQPYVEVYLHIAGQTVDFKEVPDSLYQANVQVVILFKQGGEIVKFDKYVLNSPLTKRFIDFIDLKRFALEEGDYSMTVSVTDLNREGNAREYQSDFSISFPKGELSQSGLQMLASYSRAEADVQTPFTKNGLEMEPLPFNFYNRHHSKLIFYNEIYGSDEALAEDFVVSYSIELLNGDGRPLPAMIGHKRQKPAAIVPMLISMDISKLPSGNYQLRVEVRDRNKGMLSEKVLPFQRSNPFLNMDDALAIEGFEIEEEFVQALDAETLKYSLRALTPRLPNADVEMVNTMLKKENLQGQRLYLFNYWAGESPNNPKAAYDKYMEVARAIDQQYNSGFRHGFETDRGYYYLKYGQPDDSEIRETEPSAPPYEIWTYYYFPSTRQNNVKFVFYNPSLAPGDFILLHSTAIGERSNPQWMRELYRDAPNGELDGMDPFGGEGVMDNFQRRAGRVFSDY